MNKPSEITIGKMVTLGLGWFGILFFWGFYTGTMPLFLRTFTDSKFHISLVLSLAGLSGCLMPPLVGYLSDRTTTRFGRRRPYIFFGMLCMFICFVSLPHLKNFGIVALMSGLMYLSIDVAHTPYMSLLPDITPPRQRSTASGIMTFLGNAGLIACFFLSSRLWENHPVTLFYGVAVVSAATTILAAALLRDSGTVVAPTQPDASNFFGYLRGIMQERNAVRFFAAQFLWWLGFWTVQSFLTLFMVEGLRETERKALLVPLAATLIQTCSVIPMGILGDRTGRKNLLVYMVVFWALIQVCVGFSQNFWQAVVLVGITGIPLAAVSGVGYAYMLDLIPRGRTAEFVGIGVISMAAPQIFGALAGGMIIDSVGYRFIFPIAAGCILLACPLLLSIRPAERKAREAGVEMTGSGVP